MIGLSGEQARGPQHPRSSSPGPGCGPPPGLPSTGLGCAQGSGSSASASLAGAHLFSLQPLAALLHLGQVGQPSSQVDESRRPALGPNVAGDVITSSSRSSALTCTIASTSRMVARTFCCPALPLACPFDQPGDVKRNSTPGWNGFSLDKLTHPRATQPGGLEQPRCPTFGSIVQKGKLAAWAWGHWPPGIERVDFAHCFGSPTIPALSMGSKSTWRPFAASSDPSASHSFSPHKEDWETAIRRSPSPAAPLEPAPPVESLRAPRLPPVPQPQDHPSQAPDPAPPVSDRPGRPLLVRAAVWASGSVTRQLPTGSDP